MDRLHEYSSIGVALSSPVPQPEISSILPSVEPIRSSSEIRPPMEQLDDYRRKQILLTLIDELTELRDEERERKKDKEKDFNYAAAANGHVLSDAEGIERFRLFDERVRGLGLKLQAFANAVRPLASSAGLLNAAFHLRMCLTEIQYLFQENAAELFDPISHGPDPGTRPYSARRRGKVRRHASLSPSTTNEPWLNDTEPLPQELEYLARNLHTFLDRLNDVPEFTDEAVNASIVAFGGDLKYRASCLREFESQMKVVAVAKYINDFTEDLGEHMDSMKASLNVFIEVGVPAIRYSQERAANRHLNLSTVATFFSGVTATTLQASGYFAEHGSLLPDLVNALWISGLVLSIASAINSQFAYHWRTTMFRSPRSYVPRWMQFWILRTPFVFLSMSVIAFSAGLCAFTYNTQTPFVSTLVMSFTGMTYSAFRFGLWLASERWTFAKTRGNRWLLDILEEHTSKAGKATGFTPAKRAATRAATLGVKHTRAFFDNLRRSFTDTTRRVTGRMTEAMASMVNVPRAVFARTDELNTSGQGDTESQGENFRTDSPPAFFSKGGGNRNLGIHRNMEKRKLPDLGGGIELAIPEHNSLHIDAATPAGVSNSPSVGDKTKTSGSGSVPEDTNMASVEPAGPVLPKNARFRALATRVVHATHPQAHSPRSTQSMFAISSRHRQEQTNLMRTQGLVSMLRTLRSTHILGEHIALVKHLQFSPDGQFLATCSQDKTALIWRVGSGSSDNFEVLHKLVHTSRIGGFVDQVAWSPSGGQLLTKQLKGVKVWDTKTGVCKKTIDRKRNVQSITWMPKGSGFVSVEWRLNANSVVAKKWVHHVDNILGSDLVLVNADGTVLVDHYLPRLQVWDAAVTPDEERVVAVASLLQSMDKLKPVKAQSEKRILVYNLQTKQIENQVPLLQEVRNVTLTGQGNYALVSYENKAPPQAWRLDMITREQKCHLFLAHTYFTKHPADFAGPSYFGGVDDTFVLCASKGGEIYIWEKVSGILLHSLKAPDQELMNIAWNHKSPSGFMFASAAHDGTVRIWTTTAEPALPHSPRSLAPSPEAAEVESPSLNRTRFNTSVSQLNEG